VASTEKRTIVVWDPAVRAAYWALVGVILLAPYIFTHSIHDAFQLSVLLMGLALLVFGAIKGQFTGLNKARPALQTLLVGGVAAGVAYLLAGAFG